MPKKMIPAVTFSALVKAIRREIEVSRAQIERRMVLMDWTIGRNINMFLSDTTRREKYGKNLLFRLGQEINVDHRTLYQAAQFHRVYPRLDLSLPLNWSQYRYLSRLKSESQRRYWERRIIREQLSVKDLLGLLTDSENGASAAGLKNPGRGLLYHYRVIKRSDLVSGGDVLLVDCGFENYIEPPSSTVRIDNTRIYRSLKEEGYSLRTSNVTKDKIYVYKALIERMVDADTLVVIVDCGFGIYHREILRLRFIDAPEKKTTAGRRAAAWVGAQLKDCRFVVIKTYKTDKYARYLVDVFYRPGEMDPAVVAREGAYLNSRLIEEGLAVKWKS